MKMSLELFNKMALPKGFRKNINIIKNKVGFERRQEILDEIDYKGTYLPRGVMYEDMDSSFIKFVKDDMKIVIDGEKVPVIFLTLQRWSEFTRTWQHSDEYKNIKMPFVTIVRRPNPQPGKNQAGLFNIPGRRTYTYVKVPTFEGGRRGVDIYKIPQPTSVDITYDVRIFCNRMRDLNKFNIKMLEAFNSIQYYIKVNGHPMPLILKNVGDESNIDDFDKRRFFVQPYEIVLEGYVQDEDDFEVIPTVNRAMVVNEIMEGKVKPRIKFFPNKITNSINCNVIFKPNSNNNFSYKSEYDVKFTDILNVVDTNNIIIKVNGVEKFNGIDFSMTNIVVNAGDLVYIEITRDANKTSKFTLKGDLL